MAITIIVVLPYKKFNGLLAELKKVIYDIPKAKP
ncbi:putative iron ABC transporter, permease domain protein, partial [Clostridioides difficile DA00215]